MRRWLAACGSTTGSRRQARFAQVAPTSGFVAIRRGIGYVILAT
ncbi:hypothetical protein [Pandoraea sp. B-6]